MPFSRRLPAILAALALGMTPVTAAADDPTPTISLTGSAEIAVAPDQARISSGVISEGETAREALDANNAAMGRVIAALRDAGVGGRDIQTGQLNVFPRFSRPDPDASDRPRRIIGYQVSNRVDVLVRDLETLGTILDQVVTAGANQVNGIGFEVSDADRRLDEARARALEDARRKADIYAEAGGFELERILSVSESAIGAPRPMFQRMDTAIAASVPVETGEQTLRVDVHVTWEIDD